MNNDSDNTTSSYIGSTDEGSYSLDREYEILNEMPTSGFNRIIRAKRYGKQFLLKGLKPEYQTQPQYVALLQKEFEIALNLSHPNIARVYSLEQIPQIGPCIVMEYVDGRPLDKFLQENPSTRLRLRAVRQMLDAMAYYHSLQVVHRDLKPSTIMITHNGHNVKIYKTACQFLGNNVDNGVFFKINLSAENFKTLDVLVYRTYSEITAARHCNLCPAETCKQCTDKVV